MSDSSIKSVAGAAMALACSVISAPLASHAEEASSEGGGTGWIATAYGTYDFFSADNWDQGLMTGEFGSGLGTGKTTQTIKFGQDWAGNLAFAHANEATLTLCGDGSRDATWFVPGDVAFAAQTGKGKVTFGSQTAGSKFFIDLGGKSPTFTMKGTSGYYFHNAIRNGMFRIGDESSAFVSLFNDGAAIEGDVVFRGKSKFQFDSSAKNSVGTVRAKNFGHGGNDLELKGGSSATEDAIDGTLRILDDSAGLRYVSVYAPTTNTILCAKGLEIRPGAFVCFRGTSLGLGVPGEVGANLLFDEPPELVGGLIPQAVALTTTSEGGGSSNLSFAGYDPQKGVRALDLETEFVTEAASLTGGTENLLVPHATTVTISGTTTVNAVILQGGSSKEADTTLNAADETSRLRVTSGQVLVGWSQYKKTSVNVPVDFGDTRGCISVAADKQTYWTAPILGSNGVVFAVLRETLGGNSGLNIQSDCNYTGDTYVNASLFVTESRKVFPCGDRKGDLYISGDVALRGQSKGDAIHYTVNGLNGTGTIRRYTYTVDLSLGDNDADGDFTGTVNAFRNVTKIGAGVQRLGGTISCTGVLSVNSGAVVLDGTVVSNETAAATVSVAADSAIGGTGTIETSLDFAAKARFRVGIANGKAKGPLTVAAVSAAGEVVVEAETDEWKGSYSILKVTEGSLEGIVFKKGANVGSLMLSDDKTELIATKRGGFAIIIR